MILTQPIAAPIEQVFQTVADINHFSRALPHIVKVEFLSEISFGIGTRFRETRLMNGKEQPTELEVTEYVPNERVRLVADTHGVIWDTLFTVRPEGGKTVLTMTMETRTKKLLAKVITFLISGMVRKAIARDLEMVKAYCEAPAMQPPEAGMKTSGAAQTQ